MPDSPDDDVKWAVATLTDNTDQLPAPLAAELRKYHSAPDDRPADLARQRYACSVLLGYAEAIPDPLEVELNGYARQLDYAMSTRLVQPDMDDSAFLDAVAGILRSPHRGRRIIDDIRALVHRSGRGTAAYQGEASSTGTVIDIGKGR